MARPRAFITPEQAKRGIYLDFEGLGRSPGHPRPHPHLLGALVGGKFHQFVFHPRYGPLVRGAKVRLRRERGNFEMSTLDEALSLLLERAEDQDRRLFAYSIHEQEIINRHASPEVAARARVVLSDPESHRLVNAKVEVVKPWRLRIHGGRRTDPETLKEYLKLIKFKWPRDVEGKPAKALARLDDVVGRTQRWKKIAEPDRQTWLSLLDYNHYDCAGLRRLTRKAAKGLAMLGPKRS